MHKLNKTIKSFTVAGTLAVASLLVTAPTVLATDVYIVYSGKDKALQKEVKKLFPETVAVKGYNVDLLALADYTGKQKAASKLSKAAHIIMLTEKPLEYLGEARIGGSVVTVSTAQEVSTFITQFYP